MNKRYANVGKGLRRQRGWINLPRHFFDVLFILAAIGVLSLIGFVVWGLWYSLLPLRMPGDLYRGSNRLLGRSAREGRR